MLSLEDFNAIPVDDPARNPRTDSSGDPIWILWRADAGAFMLRVTANDHGRAAIIDMPDFPNWEDTIGTKLGFQTSIRHGLGARLPADAPPSGPGLLAAAYAAIRRAYEPTPPELRPGRSQADLEAVMAAADVLGCAMLSMHDFARLECRHDPRVPISETVGAAENAYAPEGIVSDDISRWFGAFACSRVNRVASDAVDNFPATLAIQGSTPNPTAHQVLEAGAVITSFYARAAGDLGLDEDVVSDRLARLGIVT